MVGQRKMNQQRKHGVVLTRGEFPAITEGILEVGEDEFIVILACPKV